jgi:hypothetical protein
MDDRRDSSDRPALWLGGLVRFRLDRMKAEPLSDADRCRGEGGWPAHAPATSLEAPIVIERRTVPSINAQGTIAAKLRQLIEEAAEGLRNRQGSRTVERTATNYRRAR